MQDLLEAILNEDKPDPEDLFKSADPEDIWSREGAFKQACIKAAWFALEMSFKSNFLRELAELGFPVKDPNWQQQAENMAVTIEDNLQMLVRSWEEDAQPSEVEDFNPFLEGNNYESE